MVGHKKVMLLILVVFDSGTVRGVLGGWIGVPMKLRGTYPLSLEPSVPLVKTINEKISDYAGAMCCVCVSFHCTVVICSIFYRIVFAILFMILPLAGSGTHTDTYFTPQALKGAM